MRTNNDQELYWNNIYNSPNLQFPENDGFLSKWVAQLRQAERIVDLGCGNGVNTLYLQERGIYTIACDFSEPALNLLIEKVPHANVLLFDMKNGLPFLSDNIDVIIADLSLHYFSTVDTKAILSEIRRSLRSNGLFLCRVNAIDTGMTFTEYKEIEKDYYSIDGCNKRFFTVESLAEMMDDFYIKRIYEQETRKYRNGKKTIVCEAYKL